MEKPIEEVYSDLTQAIERAGGEVGSMTDLGRQDFIRVTDRNHPADFYVRFEIDGGPEFPSALHEGTRLDRTVKRILIEAVG